MAALKVKNAFFNGTPSIKDLLGEKLNFSEKKLGEKLTYKDVEMYSLMYKLKQMSSVCLIKTKNRHRLLKLKFAIFLMQIS